MLREYGWGPFGNKELSQTGLVDIEIEDLALHFDCTDEGPNLFGIKLLRTIATQCIQFRRHRLVLVRGGF